MKQTRAVRGLSTVALLKAYYDEGHDHIEMFMPFVFGVLDSLPDVFTTDQARGAVHAHHGFKVPLDTMKVLLNRMTKRDLLTREAGAFHKLTIHTGASIGEERRRIETDHATLADALVRFATDSGHRISDPEEALELIFAFISQNEVELLLNPESGVTDLVPSAQGPRRSRLVARFLQEEAMTDPALTQILTQALEGFVLQSTLLLKDIRSTERKFRRLSVFFDSGFLFGLLGLHGEAKEAATREAVELLAVAGARLGVFGRTINEMKGILAVYERKLATQVGRESLYPTPLTRHFLTDRASPSDVRELSSTLELKLRHHGIQPTPMPKRKKAFTLDEEDLSERLKRHDEDINQPRVVHDVDCVAAVLTLREGQEVSSIDRARAVFVTESGLMLRTVLRWYAEQGMTGVPPMMFHTTISNLAWLKRPDAGTKLKVHELSALCSAALQPDRRTWDRFLKHLKKLEESAVITSDEAVAVLVSSFTDQLLADLEDEVPDIDDIDAESLSEVVDRVRSTYMERAEEELAAERAKTKAKEEEVQRERDERCAVERRIRRNVRVAARILAHGGAALAAVAVGIGFFLVLPGVFEQVPDLWGGGLYLLVVGASTFGLWALLTGGSLKSIRTGTEDWLARWFEGWMGVTQGFDGGSPDN